MKTLRLTMMIGALVCAAGAASAQSGDVATSGPCWPIAAGQVRVHLTSGATMNGTLLCMGEQQIAVAAGSQVHTYPLASVGTIDKPPDGVLDGALKGAAVGVLLAVLCAGECDSGYVLRAFGAYTLAGALIDAADSHADVIYRAGAPRLAVSRKWKF